MAMVFSSIGHPGFVPPEKTYDQLSVEEKKNVTRNIDLFNYYIKPTSRHEILSDLLTLFGTKVYKIPTVTTICMGAIRDNDTKSLHLLLYRYPDIDKTSLAESTIFHSKIGLIEILMEYGEINPINFNNISYDLFNDVENYSRYIETVGAYLSPMIYVKLARIAPNFELFKQAVNVIRKAQDSHAWLHITEGSCDDVVKGKKVSLPRYLLNDLLEACVSSEKIVYVIELFNLEFIDENVHRYIVLTDSLDQYVKMIIDMMPVKDLLFESFLLAVKTEYLEYLVTVGVDPRKTLKDWTPEVLSKEIYGIYDEMEEYEQYFKFLERYDLNIREQMKEEFEDE